MSKINIHQAIFGIDSSQGHTLLEATLQGSFIKDLSTDKMGTINDWEPWEYYMRGYKVEGYYCFFRTYRDIGQKRRGAVFTHALLIAEDDLIQIKNLATVFELFKDKKQHTEQLQPIQIDILPYQRNSEYEGEIKTFIHALLNEVQRPIVWLGENDFEDVLIELWDFLPNDFKKSFSFRYSISEQDIPNDTPTLVYSKGSDSVKWNRFYKIQKGDSYQLTRSVEHLVYSKYNNECASFLQELGYNSKDFSKGEAIDIAFDYYNKLSNLFIDDVLILIRKVGFLSPEKQDGVEIKQCIMDTFVQTFSQLEVSKVKSLRNLPLEAFEDGVTVIQSCIKKFIKEYFLKSKLSTEINQLIYYCYMDLEGKSNWWLNAITDGLSNALLSDSEKVGSIIWSLWIYEGAFISWLDKIIEDKIECEQLLIHSLPSKIGKAKLEDIRKYTQQKSWLLLHAHLLLKMYSPSEALSRQLGIDIGDSISDGIKYIISQVDEQTLIELTLDIQDSRLLEYIAQIPEIGKYIDVNDLYWLEVWSLKIQCTENVWDGIENPQQSLFVLLNTAYFIDVDVSLKEKATSLIKLIGSTEPLSLLEYDDRVNVWNKIDSEIKKSFLDATKEDWLKKLSKGKVIGGIESSLENEIIHSNEFRTILAKVKKPEIILSLFENFNNLLDSILNQYIRKWVRGSTEISLDTVSLRRLGDILLNRDYVEGMDYILKHVRKNNSLSIAIKPFYSTLTLFKKAKIFLFYEDGSKLNTDEWWDFVTETFTELYSHDREIRTLWVKTGGEEADLISNGTAEDIWVELIKGFKKRRYDASFFKKLITEMGKKYKHNEKLKLIKSMRKQFL